MFFKKKSNCSYEITIIENGVSAKVVCNSKREKDKWLYNYFTNDEKWWALGQYEQTNYPSFEKWVKDFIKPEWEFGRFQSIRIRNTKTILIVKKEK